MLSIREVFDSKTAIVHSLLSHADSEKEVGQNCFHQQICILVSLKRAAVSYPPNMFMQMF